MHRLLVLALTGLAALVLSGSALAWSWPADGDVLRPFALGGDAYAAGQHRGVDVAGSEGSPVRAPAGGTVSFAGSLPTYGRGVTILTADGHAVTLVHLGSIGVAKGDVVTEGAAIGTMGWSGDAEHAVPSVHLGIRVAAQAEGYVDPLGLLPPRAVPAPAPPPAQSPAPVAAASPVSTPAVPPPAQPATPAPSAQPVTPPAVVPPVSEAPAASVTAPQASVAAPATSAPAASEPAGAVATGSPGLTVTGAGGTQVGRDASFRVDPRQNATRAATRTTDPRAELRLHAVDMPPSIGTTTTPADADVADVPARSAASSAGVVDVGVARQRPVPLAAAADGDHPTDRVAQRASARHPITAPAALASRPREVGSPPSSKRPGLAAVRAASVNGGARPGVLAAAALLLVLAAAAAARAARRIAGNGAVLRHHPDLLRQLHAAHRARLHDGGGGRVRTPSTAARP
ncbi:MAG TPA: M23 family metallopeptidase [Gaiella sp.]